jgi:hypothetical protein
MTCMARKLTTGLVGRAILPQPAFSQPPWAADKQEPPKRRLQPRLAAPQCSRAATNRWLQPAVTGENTCPTTKSPPRTRKSRLCNTMRQAPTKENKRSRSHRYDLTHKGPPHRERHSARPPQSQPETADSSRIDQKSACRADGLIFGFEGFADAIELGPVFVRRPYSGRSGSVSHAP